MIDKLKIFKDNSSGGEKISSKHLKIFGLATITMGYTTPYLREGLTYIGVAIVFLALWFLVRYIRKEKL